MPRGNQLLRAPSMLHDHLQLITAKAGGALAGLDKDIAALDKERASLVKKRDALEAKLKKQLDALEAGVDGLTGPKKERKKREAKVVAPTAPSVRPQPAAGRSSVQRPPQGLPGAQA